MIKEIALRCGACGNLTKVSPSKGLPLVIICSLCENKINASIQKRIFNETGKIKGGINTLINEGVKR